MLEIETRTDRAVPTDQFILDLAIDIIDPITNRNSAYTTSRLIVLKGRTTFPVIQLLAQKKFGVWSRDYFPFWIDGDPSNETLDNVDLAKKERIPQRKLGIPGGPDYRKRWREANQNRVRRYARESKARSLLRKAIGLLEEGED